MKNFARKYGGVLLGAVYGLVMRVLFEVDYDNISTDLFSVTFIWIVPIIIGLTPMLLASRGQLESVRYRIWGPVSAVFLFFLACFWSGKEDIICLVIISIPFLIGAVIGSFMFAMLILEYRDKKGIMYSVFLAPLLLGLAENKVPTPTRSSEIKSMIIINAAPEKIWGSIIRVGHIEEDEYTKGFFNYAGIPQPLYAELDKDTLGAERMGHFEGGLMFRERVIAWQRNRHIAFDISIIPAATAHSVFDRHVLRGHHFKFLNASYVLEPIDSGHTKLVLASSYELNTRMNGYGTFWGDMLVSDFQERLLAVVKERCDGK